MVKRIRLSPKYLPLFQQLIPLLLAGRTIKEASLIIGGSVHECYRSIQFARYFYKSRTTFQLVFNYLVETGQAEPIIEDPASGIIPPSDEKQLEFPDLEV